VSVDTAHRCDSCEHSWEYHQPNGCWFAVTDGRFGVNAVCACRKPHLQLGQLEELYKTGDSA
jgi:hypothetical protein